jgi:hypothetical protein
MKISLHSKYIVKKFTVYSKKVARKNEKVTGK